MLKIFNSKDSKGCQFKVYANYYTKNITDDNGFFIEKKNISEYSAFTFEATNLNELKKLVGNM